MIDKLKVLEYHKKVKGETKCLKFQIIIILTIQLHFICGFLFDANDIIKY